MTTVHFSFQKEVYVGSYTPIVEKSSTDNFFGKGGFGDVPDPNLPNFKETEKKHAVFAMIKMVPKFPNEVTVIVLGPLTNVALTMRLDMNFKKFVKQIIWLGGSINNIENVKPGIEFNAYFDPAVAFIVFSEPGPPIVMVPRKLCFFETQIPAHWRINVLAKP